MGIASNLFHVLQFKPQAANTGSGQSIGATSAKLLDVKKRLLLKYIATRALIPAFLARHIPVALTNLHPPGLCGACHNDLAA